MRDRIHSVGKIRIIGIFFQSLTGLATLIIFAILSVIFGNIIFHGIGHISWSFLSRAPADGLAGGGIFPAIFGTVALVFLMTIAVIPLGLCTAIYLQEYAGHNTRLTKLVRFAVNNLAGVPSIVFGLFGLGFFVYFVGAHIDEQIMGLAPGDSPHWGKPAIIWAALTMALLTLPVMIVATEESIRAIPQEIREASYALGASRWQTIRNIILPQALPGIFTGGILAIGRGAGEVAPILFLGAAYYLPHLPSNPTDQFMHLGYHIFILSTQSPDVEATKPILYASVLVLLVLTFLLNIVAILIRSKIRSRLRKA